LISALGFETTCNFGVVTAWLFAWSEANTLLSHGHNSQLGILRAGIDPGAFQKVNR
jgi:hypothetical protein